MHPFVRNSLRFSSQLHRDVCPSQRSSTSLYALRDRIVTVRARTMSNLRPLDEKVAQKAVTTPQAGRRIVTNLDEIPEDNESLVKTFEKDEKNIVIEQIRTLQREEEERFRAHDRYVSKALLRSGYMMIITAVLAALYFASHEEELNPHTEEYEDLYKVFNTPFIEKGILTINTVLDTLIKPESTKPPLELKAPRPTHKELQDAVPSSVRIPDSPIECSLFPESVVYELAHFLNQEDAQRDYRISAALATDILESYLDLMEVAMEQSLTELCAEIKGEQQSVESLIEMKYRLSRPFFNTVSKKKGDAASLVTQLIAFNAHADREVGVDHDELYGKTISRAEVRLLAARLHVDVLALVKRDLFRAMEMTYPAVKLPEVWNRDKVRAPIMPIVGNLEEELEKQWKDAFAEITNRDTKVSV